MFTAFLWLDKKGKSAVLVVEKFTKSDFLWSHAVSGELARSSPSCINQSFYVLTNDSHLDALSAHNHLGRIRVHAHIYLVRRVANLTLVPFNTQQIGAWYLRNVATSVNIVAYLLQANIYVATSAREANFGQAVQITSTFMNAIASDLNSVQIAQLGCSSC
ncbi:hypothetical protein BpHYR1_046782 [Brachionus plicatilis]|uniref:Uncharacterized protein n=1 Tax=Brachionus plicatilis TaxID=10195 RepID=A0A3M7SAH9_BRAPC|nr:hypothetical protein BpHYR1_046782 [Brachionus plicatilis]